MKLITTLFFLFLLSIGYGQIPMKEFSNDLYEIKYPINWTVTENDLGAEFFLIAPKLNAQDEFNENVNLVVQDLAGTNIDLNTYVQLSEKQISESIKDGKILRSERYKSGNSELHRIIYTGQINGFQLKLIQNYYVRDEKAYKLSFTAEESVYESYRQIGTEILQSFRFK